MCICVSLNDFCTGTKEYKSTRQYKGGSKLSCSLLKKCCKWKMYSKIAERNEGLDPRNDIDKDVKIPYINVFQIMHVTKNCLMNTARLSFFIIYVYCPHEFNGNLFLIALIFFRSFVVMPHSVLLADMNHVSGFYRICSYLLYSPKR